MSSTQTVAAQPISRGITVREFAAINSMSVPGVHKGIREGFIPCYRLGKRSIRIPLSFLEQLQRGGNLEAAREQLHRGANVEAVIERLIDAAPPLTDDQRSRISALLRIGGTTVTPKRANKTRGVGAVR
jgi:hypothetical protein